MSLNICKSSHDPLLTIDYQSLTLTMEISQAIPWGARLTPEQEERIIVSGLTHVICGDPHSPGPTPSGFISKQFLPACDDHHREFPPKKELLLKCKEELKCEVQYNSRQIKRNSRKGINKSMKQWPRGKRAVKADDRSAFGSYHGPGIMLNFSNEYNDSVGIDYGFDHDRRDQSKRRKRQMGAAFGSSRRGFMDEKELVEWMDSMVDVGSFSIEQYAT